MNRPIGNSSRRRRGFLPLLGLLIAGGFLLIAPAYSEPGFYAIAHMVNTPSAIDWAVQQGANGAEVDLRFDAGTGKPRWFVHGGPFCDCSCLSGGVCWHLTDAAHAPCDAGTAPHELLAHLAGKGLALVIIDSKLDGFAAEQQKAAGQEVVKLLDRSLFGSGYRGQVIVSAAKAESLEYLRAAATQANASANRSRYSFSIDGEADVGRALGALVQLPTDRRVYGTGISACAAGDYSTSITLGHLNERREVSGLTYVWTLDKETSMNAYLKAGARGILTNHPDRLVSLLRTRNLRLASPAEPLPAAPSNAVRSSLGTCDCDYHPGGCTISKAAPRLTACRCVYKGAWTCGGNVTRCTDASSPSCDNPDRSKAACRLGGGDCGGY